NRGLGGAGEPAGGVACPPEVPLEELVRADFNTWHVRCPPCLSVGHVGYRMAAQCWSGSWEPDRAFPGQILDVGWRSTSSTSLPHVRAELTSSTCRRLWWTLRRRSDR